MRWFLLLFIIAFTGACGNATADVQLDPISPRLATADPARGRTIFLQCKACHKSKEGAGHTVGPNLWGVVGRAVGSQPDYPYSNSLKAMGGIWDYETLSRYLFDPSAMAPDTRMVFPGIKQARARADLIAYLNTLGDKPPDLPRPPVAQAEALYGGLPEGDGREAVYFTCRACHALEQFSDRRMSRQKWDDLLTEMVTHNGMAAPEPWARSLMLNYLAANFGKRDEQDWQGLPPGPGREEVFYTCKACHSLMLVKQQGLSRERWDETLEWMVEEQGMEAIEDAAMRDRVLDYLASYFGPE